VGSWFWLKGLRFKGLGCRLRVEGLGFRVRCRVRSSEGIGVGFGI
jgi:hypothetical protein